MCAEDWAGCFDQLGRQQGYWYQLNGIVSLEN